jgi:hypothetical protein
VDQPADARRTVGSPVSLIRQIQPSKDELGLMTVSLNRKGYTQPGNTSKVAQPAGVFEFI